MSHLEDTVGSGALGVDDTLGDALSVKVGKPEDETISKERSPKTTGDSQVDQVEVLEEERSVGADATGGVGLGNRSSLGGGVLGAIWLVEDLSGGHVGTARWRGGQRGFVDDVELVRGDCLLQAELPLHQ